MITLCYKPLVKLLSSIVILTTSAQGAVVLGNIADANNAIDTSSIASNGQSKAVGFTMPTGQDWLLVDATLWTVGLDPNSGSTPDLPDLYIALDNGGIPGARHGSLPNPVPDNTSIQLTTWTSPGDTLLQGGTKYWLVVEETIGDWNWLIDDVGPPSGNVGEGDPVSAIGASFDGYRFKGANDTVTGDPALWGNSSANNPFEINAIPNPVPEPSSSLLALLGMGLLLRRRR